VSWEMVGLGLIGSVWTPAGVIDIMHKEIYQGKIGRLWLLGRRSRNLKIFWEMVGVDLM